MSPVFRQWEYFVVFVFKDTISFSTMDGEEEEERTEREAFLKH